MSDPLIRALENFVILEPGKPEQFLNAKETLTWLHTWLRKMEKLPKDLEKIGSLNDCAQHLLDTACDLEIKPGFTLQWFAVRLENPDQ